MPTIKPQATETAFSSKKVPSHTHAWIQILGTEEFYDDTGVLYAEVSFLTYLYVFFIMHMCTDLLRRVRKIAKSDY
jgi:hypothetical protein